MRPKKKRKHKPVRDPPSGDSPLLVQMQRVFRHKILERTLPRDVQECFYDYRPSAGVEYFQGCWTYLTPYGLRHVFLKCPFQETLRDVFWSAVRDAVAEAILQELQEPTMRRVKKIVW